MKSHSIKRICVKVFISISTLLILICPKAFSAKPSSYTSNAGSFNFNSASAWSGGSFPPYNIDAPLTISSTSIITSNSDISGSLSKDIYGIFTINGTYSDNSNPLTIYTGGSLIVSSTFTAGAQTTTSGTLSVTGAAAFNNGVQINSGATVNFGNTLYASWMNANSSVTIQGSASISSSGNGLVIDNSAIINFSNSLEANQTTVKSGTLNVTGNYTLKNTLSIANGAKVEVWGNLDASSGGKIDIQKGGVLIVHGNTLLGNSGSVIQGDFITLGNLTMDGGTVNNTGNIVVGGNFTSSGWVSVSPSNSTTNVYFLNPNAVITAPQYSDIGTGDYGDVNTFLSNETSSLITVVTDIIGTTLPITPIWYSYASGNWNDSNRWTLDQKNTTSPVTTMTVKNANGTTTDITSTSDLNHVITSGKTVTIPTGANINTNGGITVNTGGTLILAPGAYLTANGNITNNGTFKLQHTYTSPSSFINLGTITGNTTIEQTLTGGRNWYIGHAMNTNTSAYFGSLPAPADMQMGSYLTASSKWSSKLANGIALSTPMQGYLVYFGSAAGSYTVTHSGALYTGNQSYTLVTSGDSWNLISNPFPSYINLKSSATTWDLSNVKPTIYVRSKETGAYKFLTFNAATNVGSTGFENGLIAPMQAFWVKASSAASLTIKTTARTHPASTQTLKSAEVEPNDVLRINLSNASAIDETILVFRNIGSETLTDNDSEKRLESPGALPQLFSIKDCKNIAINVMPEDPTAYTIPLAITVGAKGAGDITLNASNITEFMPNVNVYLKDLSTGTVTDLRQLPSYTFTTEAATAQNRFELSFSKVSKAPQVATSTDVNESQNVSITAYGIGTKAMVTIKDVSFSGNVQIEMYDAVGKQLVSTVSQEQRTELPLNGSTQFVVIKVTYNGTTKSFKIMKSIRPL